MLDVGSGFVSASLTTTVPGRSIQLVDVSLPDEAKGMNLSSMLIEPMDVEKSPSQILVARTFSVVNSDNQTVI